MAFELKESAKEFFLFEDDLSYQGLVGFMQGKTIKIDGIYYVSIRDNYVPIHFGDYVVKVNDVASSIIVGKFPDSNYYSDREIASWLALSTMSKMLKELPDFLKTPKPIRTQSELDDERLAEIVDGVVRYSKQKMAVPTEWIEEYNSIIERERNKPNSK